MTASGRRPPGDGGVYWDAKRERFIAEKTVGYDARGKRIKRKGSGKSETAALRALAKRVKAYDAGLVVGSERVTVRQAVEDWLDYGQTGPDPNTRQKNRDLCGKHVIPALGGRRLRDLRAEEVDKWLRSLTEILSTRSIRDVRWCLSRSVNRAMARGYVERNVVELCTAPRGRAGRPSKALTLDQARDVLTYTKKDPLYCYVVMSLLTGARTEELRALRWQNVHLESDSKAVPPLVPYVEVWRSVRSTGDTKTRKSRRTLALPALVVEELVKHRARQAQVRLRAESWQDDDLVFPTRHGTQMNAANVRRDFRRALGLVNLERAKLQEVAGEPIVPVLDPDDWTPREMRHSFVSLLSESGIPLEEISRLVGHHGTQVTELVYRKQLRPVIETGAQVMDVIFQPQADKG